MPYSNPTLPGRIREQFVSVVKFLAILVLVTLGLTVGAHAAATPAPPAALKVAYSDWPGWVAWDIARPERLVQGSRRRRRVRLVRIRAFHGRLRRRQGGRGVHDQRRRPGDGRQRQALQGHPAQRFQQRQRHGGGQGRHQVHQGPQGQEDRSRSRLRRSPAAAQGPGGQRACRKRT